MNRPLLIVDSTAPSGCRTRLRRILSGALGAVAFAVLSCVPAAKESDPRGAVALTPEPSPGSRGEPFVTADGWTVRVDALVLQVSAIGSPDHPDLRSGGGGGELFFRASDPTELVMTGISAGPALVSVSLISRATGEDFLYDKLRNESVGPALAARFGRPPDDDDQSEGIDGLELGPSFVVIAHGEKDGRIVTLDLGLQAIFDETGPFFSEVKAVVRPNELVPARFLVVAETLFAKDAARTTLVFDDFARADANGDGKLSVDELRNAREPCESCPQRDASTSDTMLAMLKKRARRIFAAP